MATKYGYVQQDPQDTQLNWNQIATDTVDMLNNEVKVREEKKAAFDKSTQDYQTILNNVPQGENTQLNEFALNAADKLQKQMLMQETLLKSGQLNPRQYTLMRQNLTDGTDQAFSLIQDYNDEYATKMSMMSSDLPVKDRLSRMDAWMMEQVEGFANFTETELVVNPQTGIMSMAKLIPDPNFKGTGTAPLIPDPNPNNLVTVQQLQNRIKSKKTQYDVIGGAENYIEGLGEQKVVMERLGNKYKAGIFKTIEDIRTREGGFDGKTDAQLQVLATEMGVDLQDLKGYNLFQQSQKTFIDGELNSNPDFGCSVLVDFVNQTPDGREYDMTFNPDDVFIGGDPANGRIPGTENIILMESKGGRQIPNLSDEQKAVAREAYKAQIDIGLDYIEDVKVQQVYKEKRPETQTEINQRQANKDLDAKVSKIADLYGKDDMSIQGATDYFRDQNDLIQEVERNEDGIVVTYINELTGEEEDRAVSFYVMEDNQYFDKTKEEGLMNPRRIKKLYEATQADVTAGRAKYVGEEIPKLKSQAEFIESAGPLLTGESNIKEALERGGYYKDAEFNKEGMSSSKVSKKSKESFDYKEDREKYTNALVDDILFGDVMAGSDGALFKLNEADFAQRAVDKINAIPGFEGVEFTDLDSDFVSFTMPGHPSADPLIIEASFVSDDDGAAKSTKSLKDWLNAYIIANEKKFQRENNWAGKRVDGNGIEVAE